MFNKLRPRDESTGELTEEKHFEGAVTHLGRERRMVWLRGPIYGAPQRWDNYSPTSAHDSILSYNWEDQTSPIYLMVDSDGGSVSDGFILYDAIRASQAPVVTVLQNAASMASVLVAAGRRRLAYPHARVMLHLPTSGMRGDFHDMETATREVRRVTDMLADAYVECGATRTREQILVDIDREYWLNAREAIDYGLIDEIVDPRELMIGGRQDGQDSSSGNDTFGLTR
jgi:ATP-dependent Clp protease protease subunit